MAEFGWAYVSGSNLPQGVDKAVQVKNGDEFNGNSNFTYDTSTNELILSGNMYLSGTLYANEFTTNVTSRNVINLSATGSTQIGDTADDIHSFTGTVNVAGALSSSLNISASSYYGDGSNLSGLSSTLAEVTTNGNTTTNQISVAALTASAGGALITGSLFVSASAHPLYLSGLQAGDRLDANSYLALDSSGRIILTASVTTTQATQIQNAASSEDAGEIGAAEDGDYTDGLFTDFATSTPVGTAIDRFNEVLKILAPSPAPSLKSMKADETDGVSAKLSFDNSNSITDYTPVTIFNTSYPSGGGTVLKILLNQVLQNSTFQPSASENFTSIPTGYFGNGVHVQHGVYNNQEITGTLNHDVGPNSTNGYLAFASGAFGNAETGSLNLIVNSVTRHTIDLSSITGAGNPATGSATSLNSSGSGFIFLSTKASSFDGNNAEWHIFKHRTAGFKVAVDDQRKGWNHIRISHVIGSTTNFTNAITWVNDPDGASAALSVSNNRIEDVSLIGSKYVSGVQYNTDLTANYKVDINNMYKNVFPSDSNTITFSPTLSDSPSAQSVPDIGGSEDYTKVLGVTASVNYNGTYLLNGTIGMSLNASHPLKSNLSTAGATTITGMLIDADTSSPNSNLIETFEDEDFRIKSGSYNNQNAVSSGGWTSTAHMTASGLAGHEDGMLLYNRRLYNPKDADIPNAGNFSTLANVSSGQPDYSGVTGIRTYFRKIQNTSNGSIRDLKITSQKSGFKFNADTQALDTNDSHFYVKVPSSTGWMNITENFVYGSTSDGDGGLINGANNNSNNTGTGNSVHCVTFGTQSVADDDYVLVKIETNGMQGNISQLTFQLGASSETAATPQVLSDIDANNTGIDAKLSFGSSNAIVGYSNVAGSGVGSMSTINSNGDYTVSGNRRGIFSAATTIDGEINDAISGDGGSDYPAKAFYNAYSGSLVLEVNGSEVHTVDLSSTLSAINTTNGNGSRLNVSAVSFSTTSDSIPDYRRPYRTGTYEIDADDQRGGWNYARLIHRTSGDATTNYVEWVVDASGAVDNTAVNTPVLSDFDHSDIYYQSGIKYFASRPSASFAYSGSNFYSNVYSRESDAISFGTTDRCSISNIRAVGTGVTTFDSGVSQTTMPALNNNDDCETTTLQVTGTVLFDNLTSISGGLGRFTDYDVSVASTLKHPFKTNRTTSTSSKTSFMVYSGSIGSTNLNTNEHFNTEDYRIVSGNYINQAAATDGGNAWNSQTQMNAANAHGDGMVTVNGYAISPFQIGKAGDTRNNSEGSTGLQAPAGNPNYSVLSDDVRTYYRYFRNETGLAKATGFSVKLYGDAYLCAKGGSFYTGTLGENKNINVELKVPFDPSFTGLDDTSTAWGDVVRPYQAGVQPDTDGIGIYSGGNTDLNQTVDSSGRAIGIQLLEKQIRDDQYFVLKISAHKNWTGYLSRIEIVY